MFRFIQIKLTIFCTNLNIKYCIHRNAEGGQSVKIVTADNDSHLRLAGKIATSNGLA